VIKFPIVYILATSAMPYKTCLVFLYLCPKHVLLRHMGSKIRSKHV